MVLRFYPTKDATIYESSPQENTGLDTILDLVKTVEGTGSYNSRILIDFDYSAISASIVELGLNPNSFNWNLKLYSTEASEIPLDFTLECHPISQSWNMGVGRYGNLPATTEGVSWRYRQGLLTPLTAWTTSSFAANSTGSYVTVPGGCSWYTTATASQSFAYKVSDIDMNVNAIVHKVQSGSRSFSGFILKKQVADETSITPFNSIKFFSKDTHTIYSPVLEAKYNESQTNSTLPEINTNEECNVIAINLKSEYKESSIPRLKFSVRYRYPTLTYTTSSVYLDRYKIPTGSQYAIYSAHTNDPIVEFSNYTKVSQDSGGVYFSLPLEGYQPERYYKILLKIPNSGSFGSQIYDGNWIFKVAKS